MRQGHRGSLWVSAAALAAMVMSSGVSLAGEAEAWPPPGVRLLDKIVAIVNTEPVTLFELQRAAAPFVAKMLADAGGPAGLNEADLARLEREVLDSLVSDILIRAEAQKMRLEVPPEAVDAQVERVKSSNNWDDAQLETAIRQLGFESVADYRAHAKREILKNQAISIRVSSRIKVDPAEVERQFKEQFGGAQGVEERRATHILLRIPEFATADQIAALEKKLSDVREQAMQQVTTFEELARKYSQDTNAQAGGDLGWFTKGDLDPDFEAATFALGEGDISEPVRTEFGLHLIKVTGLRYRQEIDDDKRKALLRQVRFRMREKELTRLYKIWVDELKRAAFVELRPTNGVAP